MFITVEKIKGDSIYDNVNIVYNGNIIMLSMLFINITAHNIYAFL